MLRLFHHPPAVQDPARIKALPDPSGKCGQGRRLRLEYRDGLAHRRRTSDQGGMSGAAPLPAADPAPAPPPPPPPPLAPPPPHPPHDPRGARPHAPPRRISADPAIGAAARGRPCVPAPGRPPPPPARAGGERPGPPPRHRRRRAAIPPRHGFRAPPHRAPPPARPG